MSIYHSSKTSRFLLTFILIQALIMFFNVAWGGGRIDNIRLEKVGDYTQVTVYGDKPFEFSHSLEEAKNGKPQRLIIDCKDMIFDLPQHEFREGLPSSIISAIRTSQYQVTPEKIVRVVLDLKSAVVYKVLNMGNGNEATITILTTKEPNFPQWTAVKESQEDNKVVMTKPTTQTKPEIEIPAEKEETPSSAIASIAPTTTKSVETNAENQPAVPSLQPLSELLVSNKPADETPQCWKAYLKPISYADTGDVLLSQNREYTRGSPITTQSETQSQEKNVEETKPAVITTTPTVISTKPVLVSEVSLKQTPIQPASLPKTEVKSGETHQAVEDILSSGKSTANTHIQTQTAKNQPPVFSSKTAQEAPQASAPRPINHTSVPLGPYLEETKSKPVETKKSPETELAKTTAGTEAAKETNREPMVATDLGNTLKKGIGAVLGTEGVSAHESDTLATGVMTIQNPLQADLGLTPSRKLITYNPETRRDPFVPLTEREDMQFGEAPLPRFENLKLVGIIRDAGGNQALLEDEVGFGYILRSGDRIKNGYVLSVEENKALFQVEEYGGYKTMTLELNPEY
jgi:hypothetical protein